MHPEQVAEIAVRHPEIHRMRLVVDNPGGQDRMVLHCEIEAGSEALDKALVGSPARITKLRGEVAFFPRRGLAQRWKVIEDIRSTARIFPCDCFLPCSAAWPLPPWPMIPAAPFGQPAFKAPEMLKPGQRCVREEGGGWVVTEPVYYLQGRGCRPRCDPPSRQMPGGAGQDPHPVQPRGVQPPCPGLSLCRPRAAERDAQIGIVRQARRPTGKRRTPSGRRMPAPVSRHVHRPQAGSRHGNRTEADLPAPASHDPPGRWLASAFST